jgi:hypothetical protein
MSTIMSRKEMLFETHSFNRNMWMRSMQTVPYDAGTGRFIL